VDKVRGLEYAANASRSMKIGEEVM